MSAQSEHFENLTSDRFMTLQWPWVYQKYFKHFQKIIPINFQPNWRIFMKLTFHPLCDPLMTSDEIQYIFKKV